MAFKVKFTMTRPQGDTPWLDSMSLTNEADVGLVEGYLTAHGGTKTTTTGDLVSSIVYEFPTQAAWQAFYNQALPVWNRNSLMSKANDSSISVDVEVLENS